MPIGGLDGPRNYDIHPDGRRFAVLQLGTRPLVTRLAETPVLYFNFAQELKRIAPPDQR